MIFCLAGCRCSRNGSTSDGWSPQAAIDSCEGALESIEGTEPELARARKLLRACSLLMPGPQCQRAMAERPIPLEDHGFREAALQCANEHCVDNHSSVCKLQPLENTYDDRNWRWADLMREVDSRHFSQEQSSRAADASARAERYAARVPHPAGANAVARQDVEVQINPDGSVTVTKYGRLLGTAPTPTDIGKLLKRCNEYETSSIAGTSVAKPEVVDAVTGELHRCRSPRILP
jgi:hypothetical protein